MFNLEKEMKAYEAKVLKLRKGLVSRLTSVYTKNKNRRAAIRAAQTELEVEDNSLEAANLQLDEKINALSSTGEVVEISKEDS